MPKQLLYITRKTHHLTYHISPPAPMFYRENLFYSQGDRQDGSYITMRLEDLFGKLEAYKATLQTFDMGSILNSAADASTKLGYLQSQQQQLQTLKAQVEDDIQHVRYTYQSTQDDRLANILYSTLADYDLLKTCASNILLQMDMMQRQLARH